MGNSKKNIKKVINKYVSKKPLPTVEAMPVDATAVKQDPRKRKQIGNYKKVDSQFADAFRDILPVPDNVAQMLAKVVRGDARMSNKSLDDEQKVLLWDVIQNAKKRTGKADGGTEYEDYGGQYGTPTQFNNWFNRGQYNVFEGAYNSLTNPGFKLASTIGRGRYFTDPENPDKVYYTDVYDWNAHEQNFPGSNIYQKVRNTLRAGEDPNLTADKNENFRMNFELDAKEIEKLRNKKNGGWLDKYQDGGSSSDNAIKNFFKGLITPEVQRSDAPAMIKTAPRNQSIESKTWDALTHPVTAFKHLVHDGRLPNNFAAAAPLGIDTAFDITGLNPLGWTDMLINTTKSAGRLFSGNGSLGDFLAVPAGALGLAPGVNTARKIVGRHLQSNENIYAPIFNTIERGANKIGSKVSQVDQKLGKKVFKQKGNLPTVPNVDPSDLESIINYNLRKGQGVKKVDLPVEVKVRQDLWSPPGNNFVIDNIIGGNRVGSIQLRQNLAPYQPPSFTRGVMDIINPNSNKWINTLGFNKVSDFPFNETLHTPLEYAGKKYTQSDLVKTGLSGELNKAINETLKANNLGNILSGGTGHTPLGRARWENLVKKGHAEHLGRDKYMLKKNGGWLEKYNDGGPVQENYNDASTSFPPNFVGAGYNTTGRNYSPAWGGQFEDGGALPQFQPGGKTPIIVNDKNDPRLKAYNDSLNLHNKGKSYLKQGFSQQLYDYAQDLILYGKNKKIAPYKTEKGKSELFIPQYKKPTQPVIYEKPQPKPQPTPQAVIDWIEGNIKDENAPTRLGTSEDEKKYAMGGSMPGAVGFMYARTGAPSKGPRRNQTTVTDASAQDGTKIKTNIPVPIDEIKKANASAEAFNKQYVQSPNFINLLQKQGYTPKEIKRRQDEVLGMTNDDYTYTNFGPNFVYGEDESGKTKINYNQRGLGDWSNFGDIAAHEWGHVGVTDYGPSALKSSEQKLLYSKLNWPNVSENPDDFAHDIAPQENRADLVELRKALQDRGIYDSFKGGEFKQEHLDKLREKDPEYWNRSMRLYKDKDIVDLMNTIAANNPKQGMPVAQNGEEIPGQFEPIQLDPEEEFLYMGKSYEEPDRSKEFSNFIPKVVEDLYPIDININQKNLGLAQHTFTHQPGMHYDENLEGTPSESYMLKRTANSFPTDEDVRLNVQMPSSPRDVNFISNYKGAIGEVDQYPTSVPFEGEKHWNIDRFIIDPHFGSGMPALENDATDKVQQRRNVLADMYKYYLLQNKGDKDASWKQANEFMTKEIDPRISGPMYEKLRGNISYSPGTGITSVVDEDYVRNFNQYKNSANLPDSERSEMEREFLKNPTSDKQAKDLAIDWLVNYKKMSPKEAESYYKKLPKKQNGAEMKFYQNGLDFTPKSISKNGKKIIKDDMGQWAHPGEITKIGSNQITMQGVPYPVLGISDTGDMQMMYPNQDYTYNGSSVTEYPMMQNGGSIFDAVKAVGNYVLNKPDSNAENISEVFDPSGVSSWDDVYRSYNKTGLSGETALEAFGAIPMLGKAKKFGKAVDILSKGLAITKRQKRNAKAAAELLKATGKYGPSAGRATDAYQAYDQYEQGGQLTKLDQLTNFTNYNTKQPGGWLDKYQD